MLGGPPVLPVGAVGELRPAATSLMMRSCSARPGRDPTAPRARILRRTVRTPWRARLEHVLVARRRAVDQRDEDGHDRSAPRPACRISAVNSHSHRRPVGVSTRSMVASVRRVVVSWSLELDRLLLQRGQGRLGRGQLLAHRRGVLQRRLPGGPLLVRAGAASGGTGRAGRPPPRTASAARPAGATPPGCGRWRSGPPRGPRPAAPAARGARPRAGPSGACTASVSVMPSSRATSRTDSQRTWSRSSTHAVDLARSHGPQQVLGLVDHLGGVLDVEGMVLVGVGPVVAGRAQLADGGPDGLGQRRAEGRAPPAVHDLELEVRIRQRHQHVGALAQLGGRHQDPVLVGVGGRHALVDERRQALGQDLEGGGDLRPVADSHAAMLPDRTHQPHAMPPIVTSPQRGRSALLQRCHDQHRRCPSPAPLGCHRHLPRRWQSREVAVAHEATVADLARLVALYDRHDVRGGEPRPPTAADVAAVDEVDRRHQRSCSSRCARSAPTCTRSWPPTPSNDTAAGLRSRLQTELTDLDAPDQALRRLGGPPRRRRAGRRQRPAAAEHAHPLRRAGRRRRAPDERGRGGSGRRPAPDRAAWPGPGCTATSRPA